MEINLAFPSQQHQLYGLITSLSCSELPKVLPFLPLRETRGVAESGKGYIFYNQILEDTWGTPGQPTVRIR